MKVIYGGIFLPEAIAGNFFLARRSLRKTLPKSQVPVQRAPSCCGRYKRIDGSWGENPGHTSEVTIEKCNDNYCTSSRFQLLHPLLHQVQRQQFHGFFLIICKIDRAGSPNFSRKRQYDSWSVVCDKLCIHRVYTLQKQAKNENISKPSWYPIQIEKDQISDPKSGAYNWFG